jgi:hypothetical protein
MWWRRIATYISGRLVIRVLYIHYCKDFAFVNSWHVYLLIGNVLTYKHPLSATIWQLFINFVPTFYETDSMAVMSRSESGNNFITSLIYYRWPNFFEVFLIYFLFLKLQVTVMWWRRIATYISGRLVIRVLYIHSGKCYVYFDISDMTSHLNKKSTWKR